MGGSILQFVLSALGGCSLGFLAAWFIQTRIARRHIDQLTGDFQSELREAAAQRSEIADRYARVQFAIEELQEVDAERDAELETALNKAKLLARSVRALREERENTKAKLSTIHEGFALLRQQTATLQLEFHKSRDFYKRELLKSLQKRKVLEGEVVNARAEQEAFARSVESSVLKHGSSENMVMAAQLRLGQLDVLERTVRKLEAENEQLRQDARQLKLKFEARERDLETLAELKLHNAQLVSAVEALENSRKAHEEDAERYREQVGESEKLSDTLRLKLDDLEKNFADMEQAQNEAIEDVREAAVVPILRKEG